MPLIRYRTEMDKLEGRKDPFSTRLREEIHAKRENGVLDGARDGLGTEGEETGSLVELGQRGWFNYKKGRGQ